MKKILTIVLLLLAEKGFSQLWGNANSRTETRNDASTGLTSGFFEAPAPVNFPIGANTWWHLLDVRHSTVGNNFRMQFSGSFFDQKLFFRKTNNVPTTPWSKILMETNGSTTIDGGVTIGNVSTPAPGGLSIGNPLVDYTPTNVNYASSGCNLFLNAKDYTTIGFHDPGTRVDYIRVGQGLMQIGYNGGWGEPNVGLPGGGIWKNNGFVGIGTTNPQEALSVNGNIRAKQVKVEITGWPDYVFAKQYSLLPIEKLGNYLQTHQHLPEIPSAKDIEKEGINLGEMNKALLKKIEELTLYMLQQQQEIKSLNNRVDSLTTK